MTNEEAIKQITMWLYAAPDVPPMQVVQALELAVNALRAGGKDKDVPTMPAGQPLTLEQLRGMDGQPVWVETIPSFLSGNKKCEWVIVSWNYEGAISTSRKTWLRYDRYGETWLAYTYKPVHIDREAWEPCELCGTLNDEIMCQFSKKTEYDQSTTSRYTRARFCPNCCRPLTEEAWAELEKRVMGVKHYGT